MNSDTDNVAANLPIQQWQLSEWKVKGIECKHHTHTKENEQALARQIDLRLMSYYLQERGQLKHLGKYFLHSMR